MLASSIDLSSPPGQHSQPYGVYGPTQAASDSPPTMPSGVGQGNDGMRPTNQWLGDDGQGNYGMQLMNQWLCDDGTQSAYQQPRDYGQGNDGMQSTNQWLGDDGQENDGQENDGMLPTSQWSWGPSSNM